jgi:hypothetical protein
MAEYTLRGPDGDISVVGNASDRARLTALGYEDITDDDTQDAVAEEQQPAAEPKQEKSSARSTTVSAGTETRNDSK